MRSLSTIFGIHILLLVCLNVNGGKDKDAALLNAYKNKMAVLNHFDECYNNVMLDEEFRKSIEPDPLDYALASTAYLSRVNVIKVDDLRLHYMYFKSTGLLHTTQEQIYSNIYAKYSAFWAKLYFTLCAVYYTYGSQKNVKRTKDCQRLAHHMYWFEMVLVERRLYDFSTMEITEEHKKPTALNKIMKYVKSHSSPVSIDAVSNAFKILDYYSFELANILEPEELKKQRPVLLNPIIEEIPDTAKKLWERVANLVKVDFRMINRRDISAPSSSQPISETGAQADDQFYYIIWESVLRIYEDQLRILKKYFGKIIGYNKKREGLSIPDLNETLKIWDMVPFLINILNIDSVEARDIQGVPTGRVIYRSNIIEILRSIEDTKMQIAFSQFKMHHDFSLHTGSSKNRIIIS